MNAAHDDEVLFARSACDTKELRSDTRELRGDAPIELVSALDALALVDGKNRHAYCLKVLSEHVEKEIHKHTVLANVLKGNPLLVASNRSRPEQPA